MTDHASRRDAAYEATLAAIDDAVQRRCSQCHSPLPADSVSEWFCAPTEDTDCQWSWHQEHAANPRDVYNRTDAGHQIDLEQLHAPATLHFTGDATVSVMGDSGWQDITDSVSGVSVGPDTDCQHDICRRDRESWSRNDLTMITDGRRRIPPPMCRADAGPLCRRGDHHTFDRTAPDSEFRPWESSFWHRIVRRLTNSGGT